MSKTFKKRRNKFREEYEDHDDNYGHVKDNFKRSKQKRFDRALKTLDVDTLLEEDFDDFGNEYGD